MNKEVHYKVPYHKKYGGQGAGTLTNIVRGTKDFHDGQWLGWLGDDEVSDNNGAADRNVLCVNCLFRRGAGGKECACECCCSSNKKKSTVACMRLHGASISY